MPQEWLDMLTAIAWQYGQASQEFQTVNNFFTSGAGGAEAWKIMETVAGFTPQYADNGAVLGWGFNNVVNQAEYQALHGGVIGEAVDSNLLPAVSGTQSAVIPANFTETVTEAGTTIGIKEGMKSAGNFVFKTVAPAVVAVSTGISLGKVIDSALYNANPDFWDAHGMESLNPDTWNSLVSDMDNDGLEGIYKKGFKMLFRLNDDTQTVQPYIDVNAYALMLQYMLSKGVYSTDNTITIKPDVPDINYEEINKFQLNQYPTLMFTKAGDYYHTGGIYSSDGVHMGYSVSDTGKHDIYVRGLVILQVSDTQPSRRTLNILRYSNRGLSSSPDLTPKERTVTTEIYRASGGKFVEYYTDTASGWSYYYPIIQEKGYPLRGSESRPDAYDWQYILKAVSLEVIKFVSGTVIEGVTDQSDAVQITGLTGDSTIEEIIQKLKETYPELFTNAVDNGVLQPDGSVKTYTYIPVGLGNGVTNLETDTQPTSDPTVNGGGQTNTGLNPTDMPADLYTELVKTITESLQPPTTNTPTDTGGGESPRPVLPAGSASALYTVYNPTQSEVNALGAWLWSDNFIDQLKKLFSDPMQAIIGLSKTFAPPPIGGRNNIKVGYLDSGVSANVVTSQYTTVDCGTVNIYEYFGNTLDYVNTEMSLYIPFIGIVRLDPVDITRATVGVVIHVDVITGAMLAEVTVQRDGNTVTMYTFNGSASVTYPLSSGSYMGVVGAIAGLAGGIASTMLTGGALAPVAIGGAVSAVTHAKTQVTHSGNLSGNAGAMGIKKPYLIISRPQDSTAQNYETLQGNGASVYVTLNECHGYTVVDAVHVDNVACTDDERDLIESQLKSGIII